MRKKIAPWKLLQQIMGWEQTGAKNHKKDADGQDRRYAADPTENQTPSYSAEVELEGN